MIRKSLLLLVSLAVVLIFASTNAMAYDYVYGVGTRPDSSLYFTDLSGNWIIGIEEVDPGTSFEFDMWLSDVPLNQSGIKAAYWDLMYGQEIGYTDDNFQSYLQTGNDPMAIYGESHKPAGWSAQGFTAVDIFGSSGPDGDVKLMKITMDCEGPGVTEIQSIFHWEDDTNFGMYDGTRYNDPLNPPYQFAYEKITVSQVPIPGTVLLLGSGLVGLFGIRRRRNSEV